MSETYSAYVITAGDKTLRPVAEVVMAGGLRIQTEYEPQDLEAQSSGPRSFAVENEPTLSLYDERSGNTRREVMEEIPFQLLECNPQTEYVFVNIGEFSRLSSGELSGGVTSYRADRQRSDLTLIAIDQTVDPFPEGQNRIAEAILETLEGFCNQSRSLSETGADIGFEKSHRQISLNLGNRLSELFDDYLNYVFKTKTLPKNLAVQGKVSRQLSIEHSTSNTLTKPFTERYEPNGDKFVELTPVEVSRRGSKKSAFNYVYLKSAHELDYFDQLVFSAYRTCLKEHPGDPAVTFLDIANKLHISEAKSLLRANEHKRLLKEIRISAKKLMSSVNNTNFLEQAKEYKDNPAFQRYLEDGGEGEIAFTYINGVIGPIRTANGRVLDGVVDDSRVTNNLLEEYIQMNGQVRWVEGDVLITPLSANRENIMIFHYLLNKIYAMPYEDSRIRLLEQKIKYLEWSEKERSETQDQDLNASDIGRADPEGSFPAPKSSEGISRKMKELEENAQKRNMTISLDTILKDLKLIDPKESGAHASKRRHAIQDKVKRILGFWKKKGLLEDFRVNQKPTGRGVQSFTIGIFSDFNNPD